MRLAVTFGYCLKFAVILLASALLTTQRSCHIRPIAQSPGVHTTQTFITPRAWAIRLSTGFFLIPVYYRCFHIHAFAHPGVMNVAPTGFLCWKFTRWVLASSLLRHSVFSSIAIGICFPRSLARSYLYADAERKPIPQGRLPAVLSVGRWSIVPDCQADCRFYPR